MTSVGTLGERRLVASILERIDADVPGVMVGPGDDAAIITTSPTTVLTVDAITAGHDYLPALTPPQAIGHRAVAVSLSDLAAMGARPSWLVLGAELDPATDSDDVLAMVDGAVALAEHHGATLVGGDVGIRAGPTTLTVCALGAAGEHVLRRSAAQVGDSVWLVGAVGLAAIGLQLLRAGDRADPALSHAVEAHLWPWPQVAAGVALGALDARIGAIDLSDGLGVDAARVAAASQTHLALDLEALPWLSPQTRASLEARGLDWRAAIAAGGDDYALLVTAPPGLALDRALAPKLRDERDGPVLRIGRVEAASADALEPARHGVRCTVLGEDISALLGGYEHGV